MKVVDIEKDLTKENILKELIRKEFEIINYNFDYDGTDYLFETIYILCMKNKFNSFCLKNDVYPILEEKYDISENALKFNIRYATEKNVF